MSRRIEKIYSGCERVMAMIASEVDGARLDRQEGWHITLLKRLSHPYPGIRGAVLSPETFKALDLLRAFRHRERNTYGIALDADIVLERSKQAAEAFGLFHADIIGFLGGK